MIALNSFCQVVVLRDIDAFEKNTARRSRMFADSVPTKNQKEREEGIRNIFSSFFRDLVLG